MCLLCAKTAHFLLPWLWGVTWSQILWNNIVPSAWIVLTIQGTLCIYMTYSMLFFLFCKGCELFNEVCIKSIGWLYTCFLILFAKFWSCLISSKKNSGSPLSEMSEKQYKAPSPTEKQSCPWIKVYSNRTRPRKQTPQEIHEWTWNLSERAFL